MDPRTTISLGQSSGSYALATSTQGNFLDTSDLYTPTLGRTGPQCKLVFYYNMNGPDVDSLIVYAQSNGIKNQLWAVTGSRGVNWHTAEVFIGAKYSVVIGIQARRGQMYQGAISVDNVQFVDCLAPLRQAKCAQDQFTCSNHYCINPDLQCNYADDCGDKSDEGSQCDYNYPGRCSFSHGICNFWSNDDNDNFDWTLAKGSDPAIGTGPSTDHTTVTGDGGYLFINSAPPQTKGDIARLSSVPIKGSSTNCALRFWYHMWGSQIGFLTVLKRHSYNTEMEVLGSLNNDHGDAWHLATYSLDNSQDNTDYQIVIQGMVGSGVNSDIAIDDISLTPGCVVGGNIPGQPTPMSTTVGTCGAGRLKCTSRNKCYDFREQCDFIDACGDNSDELTCGTDCDFESGQCGWKNSAGDNSDWDIQSGSGAASAGNGPTIDHTQNSAQGSYIMAQNRVTFSFGDVALLESSVYAISSPACALNFWYNTNGDTSVQLNVNLKTSLGPVLTIASLNGNGNKAWQRGNVTIGAYRGFAVQLEVRFPAGGLQSSLSIDDIHFSKCAPTSEVSSCSPTQFMCRDRHSCLGLQYRCDSFSDCTDGSDEDGCVPSLGDCNFDDPDWLNKCQWVQLTNDDSDWQTSSSRLNPTTGPDADHQGTQGGQFLWMNSAGVQNVGDVVDISTPTFKANTASCYVRFFYYMYGSSHIGPLRVLTLNNNGERNIMWSTSGNQGPNWNYANVLVGDNTDFSVIFEASVGDLSTSDIGIDDVSFTPECATGKPLGTQISLICNAQTSFKCVPRNECLPRSWMCDGTLDCPDGTDEPSTCPTTTGPPLPSGQTTPKRTTLPPKSTSTTPPVVTPPTQNTCPLGQFQCGNSACIPGILRCDGVSDCADNADEIGCKTCRLDFVYCNKQRMCITNVTRCDGTNDCGDNSDESLCNNACSMNNFCQNGGTCLQGSKPPRCTCNAQNAGARCQYAAPNYQRSVQPSSGTGWKVGVGVSVSLVAIVLILVGAYFYMKRYRNLAYMKSLNGETGLANPVYDGYGTDGQSDQFQMETSIETNGFGIGATSIDNPLYTEA